MSPELANWAGNHVYHAPRLHEPESFDELCDVVTSARDARVLGTRHSFNDLADTDGELISLARMPRIFELDAERRTVTVDGGARYGEVCMALDEAGFGLPAMASLPHISVAGACATATHGSGDRTANLASTVRAVEVLTAAGEVVRLARDTDADVFPGAVVSLGALGVTTRLTLDVEPAYEMRQDVYEDLPLASFVDGFETITSLADGVSFFTDWRERRFHQVWLKRRLPVRGEPGRDPLLELEARPATRHLHPIPGHPAEACTPQLGEPGRWHDRLPHFRLDHTPSSGDELQSEYVIGREHIPDAVSRLWELADRLAPLVQVSEIRTIAADDLWLSPAFGRASASVHFTWIAHGRAVLAMLPIVEEVLEPFAPRPHWAKLFEIRPAIVRSRYPRLTDFAALARRLDPSGIFANDYVRRLVLEPT
jgi:alditol oxidase